ncbi:MAG: MFS transporter [Deltaproteobacteria bacterium]|nr:MFS transporter [Deltaproteobacteria bacterium]
MSEQKPEFNVGKGRAYYFFILFFLVSTVDYLDRMVVTALFPFMKAELGVSDTQLALLVSSIFWSVMAFSVPIAWLMDRWSRTKGVGLFTIAWSLCCAIIGFLKTFPLIFSFRLLMGIGESAYSTGCTALTSAYFPENQRARMNGILTASVPVGAVLGTIGGGIIAETLGWRYAFGIVAIPALIIGLLFFTLRDYKSVDLCKTVDEGVDAGKKVKMKVTDIVKDIFSKPSLVMNFLGFVGNVFVTTSLMTWLPTYFYKLMDKPNMGTASMQTAGIFILAVVGAPIGGIVTDWLRQCGLKRARMVVPAVSSAVAALLLLIAFLLPPGTPQYLALLGMGFFAPWFYGGAATVTQDVVHAGLRSTSYGIANVVQNLLGASLGPIFVGMISDRINLLTALQLLPIFMLLGGVMFFIGSFFYLRDKDRVEKVTLELA